jgi:hypothetical protein
MIKRRLIKLFIFLLSAGVIISVLFSIFYLKQYLCYDIRNFKGQGEISDLGPWTYPRYLITFDEIDLNGSGQHEIVVKGLPPVELTFCFLMRGDCQQEFVRTSKSNIRVSFTDNKDRVISSASAPAPEWVFSQSASETILWHPECRDIRFIPNKTYTLRIEIEADDNSTRSLPARPFLRGGGLELP